MRSRWLLLAALFAVLLVPVNGWAQRGGKGGGGGGGGGKGGGGGGGGGGGMQSKAFGTLQSDPKVAAARSDLDKAQSDLDALTVKLTTDFTASDEYVAAQKALKDAMTAYEAAKDPVLKALKQKSDYKAAAAAETAAQLKVDDLKADPDATQAKISAAATDLFNKSGVTDKMERDAYAADPTVSAANAAVVAGRDKLAQLKTNFKNNLPQNADYAAAKQKVDDAHTKLASLQGGG